ncbi:MAG TPA: hypothetical protein VM802_20470 [Chitinophaga sp.]|uniref:terpene synthase family protein n=1 Tax=Chitinophaga sp. TaxID=1869181 RepID=UPI002CCF0912|nr:hypothetical protein [Chitinophaga sp.]HVI47264.1 hypothetical protein [Chitinophaga sp.]
MPFPPNNAEQLQSHISNLLSQYRQNRVSPSVYDTAWVAMIPAANTCQPRYLHCLQWLIAQQQPDGSWSNNTGIHFNHDRIICTLAALIACKTWHAQGLTPADTISNAITYLSSALQTVETSIQQLVSFELLLPALLEKADALGIVLADDTTLDRLKAGMTQKLRKIEQVAFFCRPHPAFHSLEGLPSRLIQWEHIQAIQDSNGGILSSPSATAFAYLKTGNTRCLHYIDQLINDMGYIPAIYPVDNFATAWMLDILLSLELKDIFSDTFSLILSNLYEYWDANCGITWSSTFSLPDLDTTAVTCHLLQQQGKEVAEAVFLHFRTNNIFQCFTGELTPSPSHLLHLLRVVTNPEWRQDILRQLEGCLSDQLMDKWHLSPCYLIAILMKVQHLLPEDKIQYCLQYLQRTQYPDGGWGISISNPEETGWACLALYLYSGRRQPAVTDMLYNGIGYLLKLPTPDKVQYQPLWIDKSLYALPDVADLLINALLLKYQTDIGLTLEHQVIYWAQLHIAVDTERIAAMITFAISSLQGKDISIIEAYIRINLFIFAIDDIYDSPHFTPAELEQICPYLLGQQSHIQMYSDQHTALVNDLADMYQEVTGKWFDQPDQYPLVFQYFRECIQVTTESMLEEARNKYTHLPVTLDDYIENGKLSIGVYITVSFMIRVLQPKYFNNRDHINDIDAIISTGGKIIRLLNDKRSFQKELAENKINSLIILMNTTGYERHYSEAAREVDHIVAQLFIELETKAATIEAPAMKEICQLLITDCYTVQTFYSTSDFKEHI